MAQNTEQTKNVFLYDQYDKNLFFIMCINKQHTNAKAMLKAIAHAICLMVYGSLEGIRIRIGITLRQRGNR